MLDGNMLALGGGVFFFAISAKEASSKLNVYEPLMSILVRIKKRPTKKSGEKSGEKND